MRSTAAVSSLQVAVIDADRGFLHVLDKRLSARGWAMRVLRGPVAAEELTALRVGALVVDLARLGEQGWAYLERVCRALPELPVVVCTAPASVAARVRGLRLGADDWVTKPCHPEELIARIEAAVRRGRVAAAAGGDEVLEVGELSIRPDRYQAYVGSRSLELTRREFELLRLLACNPDRVLEREEIYQRVWGYTMAHGDRSVDVFIRKLRAKLQRHSPSWTYIHTHFGVGYRFEPLPADPSAAQPPAPSPGAEREQQPAPGLEAEPAPRR